ncbi:MAG: ABC transporter permease [Candidatus Eremiobacteraeota bacterium]|nr:ABC transporter permease [Candidatus Eremiobacteraeota bacterium]
MAVKKHLSTFLSAFWLGWQIEANWAHPLLFTLYSIIKPISSCLILVVMYFVVTGGRSRADLFAFMYVGNAFFMLVLGSLQGLSMVLHIEREHYQTLKYVYIATSSLHVYLFGRAAARIVITALSVLITLVFGIAVFHLPIGLGTIDYPLLLMSLFLGLVAIASFGLILAAISMVTAMHNFFFSAAAGSLFYFLSGVLYPLSVLPPVLQKVALYLPFTYWMEAVRRAVIPSLPPDPLMAGISTAGLIGIFSAITALFLVLSLVVFNSLEKVTRRAGTIDMTTAY